jgi:hypothetical protein
MGDGKDAANREPGPYEPPALVGIGSVANLTGQPADSVTTDPDPVGAIK